MLATEIDNEGVVNEVLDKDTPESSDGVEIVEPLLDGICRPVVVRLIDGVLSEVSDVDEIVTDRELRPVLCVDNTNRGVPMLGEPIEDTDKDDRLRPVLGEGNVCRVIGTVVKSRLLVNAVLLRLLSPVCTLNCGVDMEMEVEGDVGDVDCRLALGLAIAVEGSVELREGVDTRGTLGDANESEVLGCEIDSVGELDGTVTPMPGVEIEPILVLGS